MFPHRKIHKYTWTSPEANTHNQIDHVLIDRRRHSSILDVRSFRGADCDTDRYLVVAAVRERLLRRYRSTIGQIFYIRQILAKKRQNNGTVHQLLIDFKEAYDSVRREVLYNIVI
jgi:hypothetical protein